MSRVRYISVLLATLMVLSVGQIATPQSGSASPEAIESAKSFLALIDQGKYDESWEAAASSLKSVVKQGVWGDMMTAVRRRFGKLGSRQFETAQATTTVPGSPDGEYVVVTYRSAFNGKRATETVTVQKDEDGKWKVLRYGVNKAK